MFDAREAPGVQERYAPSFNIAPTCEVVGLAVWGRKERVLDLYRWGLVPSSARYPSIGGRLFNARAEGLTTRPALADAFATRRLVMLADGRLVTCSMVTTVAGPDLTDVHDRMPVILEGGALAAWLDPAAAATQDLEALLRPAPAGTLIGHPVTPRVGDVRNDDPDLVAAFQPEAEPPGPGAEPCACSADRRSVGRGCRPRPILVGGAWSTRPLSAGRGRVQRRCRQVGRPTPATRRFAVGGR